METRAVLNRIEQAKVQVQAAALGQRGRISIGLTTVPLRNEPGDFLGFLALFTDLTPIRSLEAQGQDGEAVPDAVTPPLTGARTHEKGGRDPGEWLGHPDVRGARDEDEGARIPFQAMEGLGDPIRRVHAAGSSPFREDLVTATAEPTRRCTNVVRVPGGLDRG